MSKKTAEKIPPSSLYIRDFLVKLVKAYLDNFRRVEADVRAVGVIISDEEAAVALDHSGVAIAVCEIVLKVIAVIDEGLIVAVARVIGHIDEGKSAVTRDGYNEGGSFWASPYLGERDDAAKGEGIEYRDGELADLLYEHR